MYADTEKEKDDWIGKAATNHVSYARSESSLSLPHHSKHSSASCVDLPDHSLLLVTAVLVNVPHSEP